MKIKRFLDRYLDTILYLLIVVCLIAVMVTTFQLKTEVSDLKVVVEGNVVDQEIVEEEKENEAVDDNGSVPGDDIEAQWPRLYTDEDAIALAKMAWGEARGVPELEMNGNVVSAKCQQAAVMWTVLNRYDAGYAESIKAVATAPKQYHGYSVENPVEDEFLDLAYDVLDRWNRERHGETDVGRVLESDYFWFHGDGTHNWFRNEYKSSSYWNWELADTYI